jgi:hypothetical protein
MIAAWGKAEGRLIPEGLVPGFVACTIAVVMGAVAVATVSGVEPIASPERLSAPGAELSCNPVSVKRPAASIVVAGATAGGVTSSAITTEPVLAIDALTARNPTPTPAASAVPGAIRSPGVTELVGATGVVTSEDNWVIGTVAATTGPGESTSAIGVSGIGAADAVRLGRPSNPRADGVAGASGAARMRGVVDSRSPGASGAARIRGEGGATDAGASGAARIAGVVDAMDVGRSEAARLAGAMGVVASGAATKAGIDGMIGVDASGAARIAGAVGATGAATSGAARIDGGVGRDAGASGAARITGTVGATGEAGIIATTVALAGGLPAASPRSVGAVGTTESAGSGPGTRTGIGSRGAEPFPTSAGPAPGMIG